MVYWLILNHWKEKDRSGFWHHRSITIVLLGLLLLYFIANLIFIGFFLKNLLLDIFPGKPLINGFSKLIFYYFLINFILRFFLQSLPVISVRPYLHLPIRRRKIFSYQPGGSLLSLNHILLPDTIFFLKPDGAVSSSGYLLCALREQSSLKK
jgi:hypothetical protein